MSPSPPRHTLGGGHESSLISRNVSVRFGARIARRGGEGLRAEVSAGGPGKTWAIWSGFPRKKLRGKGLTAGSRVRILALDRRGPHPLASTAAPAHDERSTAGLPSSPSERFLDVEPAAPRGVPEMFRPVKKGDLVPAGKRPMRRGRWSSRRGEAPACMPGHGPASRRLTSARAHRSRQEVWGGARAEIGRAHLGRVSRHHLSSPIVHARRAPEGNAARAGLPGPRRFDRQEGGTKPKAEGRRIPSGNGLPGRWPSLFFALCLGLCASPIDLSKARGMEQPSRRPRAGAQG